MVGHTSDKRWNKNGSNKGFSDEVTELSRVFIDTLYKAERLSLELEELCDYAEKDGKSVPQAVADLLFKEEWENREIDPLANPGILADCASKEELAKVEDSIAAVAAAKELFDFANDAKNGKSRISKMRRMA